MWSSVTTFSATSTGFRSGRSSIEVLSRISPVSGASRASIGIGCGHTVGCETQGWAMENQGKPSVDPPRTTSIASSMMAVGARSVGLQNGVRWKPIRTGVFYSVPPPGWLQEEVAMTTMLEELLRTRVARFVDRQPDWDAFADARVEGYRRAHPRYITASAPRAISAEHFTLSVMFLPPGQGNAAHTHEVEEVFFILDGKVKVFFEDGAGGREETVLGRWDCVSAPAGGTPRFPK